MGGWKGGDEVISSVWYNMCNRTPDTAISTTEYLHYSINGCRTKPTRAWTSTISIETDYQISGTRILPCHSLTAVWSGNDWTWLPRGLNESNTLVLDVVMRGPTGDDSFCPPKKWGFFFHGMKGTWEKIQEKPKLKMAVSRKCWSSRWGNTTPFSFGIYSS